MSFCAFVSEEYEAEDKAKAEVAAEEDHIIFKNCGNRYRYDKMKLADYHKKK